MLSVDDIVEKLEPPYTDDGNVKWDTFPLWKTVCQLPKMLNEELLYDPAFLLLHIYPTEMKPMSTQKLIHSRSYKH